LIELIVTPSSFGGEQPRAVFSQATAEFDATHVSPHDKHDPAFCVGRLYYGGFEAINSGKSIANLEGSDSTLLSWAAASPFATSYPFSVLLVLRRVSDMSI
jgi:hypothetical protein